MDSTIPLVIQILVVVIIFPLLVYIFNREKSIMLSKEEHAKICQANTKDLMISVKELLTEKVDDLKEFMSKDIKIAILEEMRNGKRP